MRRHRAPILLLLAAALAAPGSALAAFTARAANWQGRFPGRGLNRAQADFVSRLLLTTGYEPSRDNFGPAVRAASTLVRGRVETAYSRAEALPADLGQLEGAVASMLARRDLPAAERSVLEAEQAALARARADFSRRNAERQAGFFGTLPETDGRADGPSGTLSSSGEYAPAPGESAASIVARMSRLADRTGRPVHTSADTNELRGVGRWGELFAFPRAEGSGLDANPVELRPDAARPQWPRIAEEHYAALAALATRIGRPVAASSPYGGRYVAFPGDTAEDVARRGGPSAEEREAAFAAGLEAERTAERRLERAASRRRPRAVGRLVSDLKKDASRRRGYRRDYGVNALNILDHPAEIAALTAHWYAEAPEYAVRMIEAHAKEQEPGVPGADGIVYGTRLMWLRALAAARAGPPSAVDLGSMPL